MKPDCMRPLDLDRFNTANMKKADRLRRRRLFFRALLATVWALYAFRNYLTGGIQ